MDEATNNGGTKRLKLGDLELLAQRDKRGRPTEADAIGAFRDATLGYFDWKSKDYQKIPVVEQVEVLSLIGDVAISDGKPTVHAHVVVGRADGSTRGGHLLQGHVRPTLEVVLVESPAHLRKRHDPESGLALIAL
jgi:predicted DNA-binding protein with PD1-like motif